MAVYDGRGALVTGRPPEHLAGMYDRLSTSTPETVRNREESYRVLARTLTTRDGVHARAVLTERLEPYEQTERYALFLCIGAGLLLVAAATSVAAWASHRVLKPVSEMARTAEDWSEHDSRGASRSDPRATRSPRSGRRWTGCWRRSPDDPGRAAAHRELAHELRTPLTVIRGNVELMTQRSDLTQDARDDLAEGIFHRLPAHGRDHHQPAQPGPQRRGARPHGRGPRRGRLRRARPVPGDGSSPRVTLDSVPELSRTSMPTPLAARALVPVLENAARFGTRVQVEFERTSAQWLVHIDDDGPGLETGDPDSAFAPGYTTGDGAGLGLSLARRIARSGGGDVVSAPPPSCWSTRFTVALPRAAPARSS